MEVFRQESQKTLEEGVSSAKSSLEEELEKERTSHQARIKEFNRLEQRYENLKDELELTRSQAVVEAEPESNTSSGPPSPPDSAYNSISTYASAVQTEELLKEKDNLKQELMNLRKSVAESAGSATTKDSAAFKNRDNLEGDIRLELTRLSNENIEFEAQIESLEKQNKELKRQLKLWLKWLNTMEMEFGISTTGVKTSESSLSLGVPSLKVNGEDSQSITGHPAVKHKDAAISGMLKYKKGDDLKATKDLIQELKPRSVAVSLIPGLPAHLLFMLLRYADHRNDDTMIKNLLGNITSSIKKVEKEHEGEFEYVSFWLANTCRFLHNMKQYSGDAEYMKDNTPTQNEHCLRNFDLAEYRQVFSDMAVSLYQKLVLVIMHEIKPMIVPAMLEHDTIQGLSTSVKPSGMRGRSSSRSAEAVELFTVETIIKQLTAYHIMMNQHQMDQALIRQVFKQVMYGIAAHSINNQLLRKELCNWSKAMQIRCNVFQLEDWIRKTSLSGCGLREMLEPLVEASQLLQVKKQSSQDADAICKMCSHLTPVQIVKLLNMITPANDYEERVPVRFIKIVQGKLKQTRQNAFGWTRQNAFGSQQTLLMDNGYMFGVTFPFSPSNLSLDEISLPESLNLTYLKLI